MRYERQIWRNDDPSTPLSAARLNHLESGLYEAAQAADTAGENAGRATDVAEAAKAGVDAVRSTVEGLSRDVLATKTAADTAGKDASTATQAVETLRSEVTVAAGKAETATATTAGFAGDISEIRGGLDSLRGQVRSFARHSAPAWEPGAAYEVGDYVLHAGEKWVMEGVERSYPERVNIVHDPQCVSTSGWDALGRSRLSPGNGRMRVDVTGNGGNNAVVLRSRMTGVPNGLVASASAVFKNVGDSDISLEMALYGFSGSARVSLAPGETKKALINKANPYVGSNTSSAIVVMAKLVPGTAFEMSEPIVERSESVGDFFHGDMPGAHWEGAPNSSSSIMAARNTIEPVQGEPGTTPATWKLVPQQRLDRPGFPEVDPGEGVKAVIYPGDLSHDRTRFLSVEAPQLRISHDDCETWKNVYLFADPVRGVRWLPDGEALVATKKADNSEPFRVWRSSGLSAGDPAAATWTQVMQGESAGNGPAHGWSWFVDGNICLVADYGAKDGTDKQARFVYLSVDMGRIWKRIFELERKRGLHVHGVAWDRWWDRIWVTHGDDEDGIYVSDDLGVTWRRVKHGTEPNAPYQAVGIVPLEDCILLASDGIPNGLWRIPRSQGRNAESYEVEEALKFNDLDGISHLCHSIYRAPGLPDAPVLLAYGAETRPETSMWVATRTGWDAAVIFRDPIQSASGQGARQAFGPTLRGNLIMTSTTPREGQSGGRTLWRVPWTTAYKNA